jgi:hypothetical protein
LLPKAVFLLLESRAVLILVVGCNGRMQHVTNTDCGN